MLKKSLLTLAGLFVLSSLASANLGDTFQKSCSRYGQPDKTGDGSAHWVINNNNTITETFAPNGACDAIWYYRFGSVFSDDEILTKIGFNVPLGQPFYETPVDTGRFWQTRNLSRTALLMLRDNHGQGRNPYELSIWTKGHHERLEAAKATVPDQNQPVVDVDGSSI
jgi:hypothetical protein